MRRAIYLLSGPSHAANLACSLATLRQHYDGQVDVFTWEESLPFVQRMYDDPRLGIDIICWQPEQQKHNETFCDKTRLIPSLPHGDAVLFLDADTTIHGALNPLFDLIERYGYLATQFCDWTTEGRITGGRIKSLYQFHPGIDAKLIDAVFTMRRPSLNSGIFGGVPESPCHDPWYRWTVAARNTHIPDEKTQHLLLPIYAPLGQMATATDLGKWNCSPHLRSANLSESDVAIFHFHGDSHLRPDKSPRGCALWRLVFDYCLTENLGGITDWVSNVPNKYLKRLLQEPFHAMSNKD